MQLSIFDVPTITNQEPAENGETIIYEKWKMLELLDSLKGQAILVKGHDAYQEFCLPIIVGEMAYSTIYKGSFPNICRIGKAGMRGVLNKITSENKQLSFTYDQVVNRTKEKKKIYTKESIVAFDLNPSFIDLGISKRKTNHTETFESLPLQEKLKAIVGGVYTVQVRCHDDLFTEIISCPCKILDIQVNEDQLTIQGSNELFIQIQGFQKIRGTSDLLLDIFNEDGGYTRTIHLMA